MASHSAYPGIKGDLRLCWRVIRNPFDFLGRSSRTELLLYYIVTGLIGGVVPAMTPLAWRASVAFIYYCVVIVPMPALMARRVHDMGKPGWWAAPGWLIVLVTAYGMWRSSLLGPYQNFSIFDGTGTAGFIVGAITICYLGMLALAPPLGDNCYGADPRMVPEAA